jgi:hypothetical protein
MHHPTVGHRSWALSPLFPRRLSTRETAILWAHVTSMFPLLTNTALSHPLYYIHVGPSTLSAMNHRGRAPPSCHLLLWWWRLPKSATAVTSAWPNRASDTKTSRSLTAICRHRSCYHSSKLSPADGFLHGEHVLSHLLPSVKPLRQLSLSVPRPFASASMLSSPRQPPQPQSVASLVTIASTRAGRSSCRPRTHRRAHQASVAAPPCHSPLEPTGPSCSCTAVHRAAVHVRRGRGPGNYAIWAATCLSEKATIRNRPDGLWLLSYFMKSFKSKQTS